MHPPLTRFPRLATERLSIRPLLAADSDALASLTDDPAITGVVHFLPSPFTSADAAALIGGHDDDNCFLGLFRQGRLIGVVGTHAHGVDGAEADGVEIGYWIGPEFQRRGHAREAVSAVISALRHLYPARPIVAECRVGNDASWALLRQLGFDDTGRPGKRPGRRLLRLS